MHFHGIDDVYGLAELEVLGSAVVAAHELGHDLGDWRLVEDRMHLANCRSCSWLAWIVCMPGEETWRAGGSALSTHCEEQRRF
jgi:hypothetical protein